LRIDVVQLGAHHWRVCFSLSLTAAIGAGEERAIRPIAIGKFGIAIATTFIGMTLRIILIQLRQTASDQEEEARESIAKYVVALNSDISETIAELRRFRNEAVGNAAESAKEFGRQMVEIGATSGDAVQESNRTLLKSVQQVTANIDHSMQEVVRRLNQLEVPTDVFTTRLQSSADALSREIEQLRQSLHDGTGSFAISLTESVGVMGRIKGEIENLQTAIASANRNVSQTAALAAETVAGTQRFAQTTSDAAVSMQQFRLTAVELARALTDLGSRLDTRGKEYESGLEGVRDELKAAAADVRSNADGFSKAVVETAVALTNAIKETRV
jgi:polyhydroxyalkanoate synthesis regulator phasin